MLRVGNACTIPNHIDLCNHVEIFIHAQAWPIMYLPISWIISGSINLKSSKCIRPPHNCHKLHYKHLVLVLSTQITVVQELNDVPRDEVASRVAMRPLPITLDGCVL